MKKSPQALVVCIFSLFVFSSGWDGSHLTAQSGHSLHIFRHGVASGDPLDDRVIIWTRVSMNDSTKEAEVSYRISRDSAFKDVVTEGVFQTSEEADFTVKIDVDGLSQGTTYFYQFEAGNEKSPVGRTQTAGMKPGQKNLRFGVVSCNNYEAGYFAAFRRLSEKPDLNAIIHLGDYIYEYYRPKVRKRKLKNRRHDPPHELLVLSDYRQRYAQYRTDPDLQELHRLYPFITIWDDHEAANNSHAEGASAHNEVKEGDWQQRLETAKRVYFEWMPIRDHPRQYIYRKISYGNLADLMMLDTRYEGRDPQIYDMLDSAIFAPDRSMLGIKQKDWLLNSLKESKAKWKLIGNQVIFSPLYAEHLHKRMENAFLDIWDGYPAERLQITQFIKNNDIENVVILTGDFHTSLAMEVPLDDWNHPQVPLGYNPKTGENAVAIEFATPSITSNNFDDFARLIKPIRWLGLGRAMGKLIQRSLLKDEKRDASLPGGKRWINPHIKYGNFIDHGYFILTLGEDKVQADFYHIKNRYKKDSPEKKTKSLFSGDGENHLHVIKN